MSIVLRIVMNVLVFKFFGKKLQGANLLKGFEKKMKFHYYADTDNTHMLKQCISKGYDVNSTTSHGSRTPLILAARKGYAESTKILIEAKADVNITDSDGWTALNLACFWDRVECVTLLVHASADTCIKHNAGDTPLFHSITSSIECTKILIEAKADISISNRVGETPLYKAIRTCRIEHTTLFLDAGAKLSNKHGDLPEWASLLISKRKNIKHTIICFMALAKKTKSIHKDLIGEVVSMIWSTRDDDAWEGMTVERKKIKNE